MGMSEYGINVQDPAPQGPGLGGQDPSVKAMTESGVQLSRRFCIMERDSFC